MAILKKADIHGISMDSDFKENKKISIDDTFFNYYSERFNFNFNIVKNTNSYFEKMNLVFSLYSLERYEEAFKIIKLELINCKLNKAYDKMIICMINYNIILWQLKYNFSSGNKTYEREQDIDIDSEFSKFPESIQEEIRPIYEFANFKYLYKEFYNIQNILEKIRKHKYLIANNCLSRSEETGTISRHKNLVDFIVNNGICIEDYEEYKGINEKYFEISIINNSGNKWCPNKTDLYTAIKYIKTKDMKEILELFTANQLTFNLSKENHNWLIDVVLENCVNNYCNRVGAWSKLETYLENSLLLLSILKNAKSETDRILDKLIKLVQNTHNTIQIFDGINLFLGIQYNYFSNKDIDGEKTLQIVVVLLNKFVSNNINGYENFAISQNKLTNLLGCSSLTKAEFKDDKLLSKFLHMVEQQDISEQLDMSQGFILQLYCICNQKCKDLIISFIKGNINNKSKTDISYLVNYYSFKIYLQLLSIETLPTSFIDDISKLIDELPKNSISSRYNLLNFRLEQLAEQDEKYKEIFDKLNTFINDGIKKFNQCMGNSEDIKESC